MARGNKDAPAMEMTKWFDTNYHYIVPELTADTAFALSTTKAVDEFKEAKFLGITTRPVLIGPVTFLKLAKMRDGSDRWALLPKILPIYQQVLKELAAAGAEWVQIDEPILVADLDQAAKDAFNDAYCELTGGPEDPARHLFRRAGRQSEDRSGAAGRRPAYRSGARARPAGRGRQGSAQGAHSVAGPDQWPQHLEDRSGRW